MKREEWIDLLKIIAIFLVVIAHTVCVGIANNNSQITHIIYYLATYCIPLFFMINGYLQLSRVKKYQYCLKKIFKIVEVCFLWNIPIYIIKNITSTSYISLTKSVALNFLQEGYFFQFWFLGALIIIYLFLPLLQKLFNRTNKYKTITALLIILCIIIDIFNIINNNLWGNGVIKDNIKQVFRIWTWITYFFIGGCINKGNLMANISTKKMLWVMLICLVVSTIYQYTMASRLYNNLYFENFYDSPFIILTSFCIFMLIKKMNINNGKISIIGQMSMGVYIMHPTLIKILQHFGLMNNNYLNMFWAILIFAICTLITYILSKIPRLNQLIRI